MSIIRRRHKNNFVIISNKPLEDKKLSWQSKGLLAYLLSKPNDWRVHVNQLSGASKNGRDSTRKSIQELVDSGYITKSQVRDGNGRIIGWDYVVSDESSEVKEPLEQIRPQTENPTSGKPTLDNPTSGNRTLLSTDLLSTDKLNTERDKESVPTEAAAPTESSFIDGLNSEQSAEPRKEYKHDKLTLQAVEWINKLSEEMDQNLHPLDRETGKPTKYLNGIKVRIKEHGLDAMLDMLAYKIKMWKGTMYEENLNYKTLCREDNCRNYVWQAKNEKKKSNPKQIDPKEAQRLYQQSLRDAENGIV